MSDPYMNFIFSSLIISQSSPFGSVAAMKFRHKPLRYLFRCFIALVAKSRWKFHN